jgi:PAS domain S-box-containing protein
MSDEPDIVKELKEEKKQGILQTQLLSNQEQQQMLSESEDDVPNETIFADGDVKRTTRGYSTVYEKTGKEKRRSGIDIIGDVPWGMHLCQFYQTKEDLIDILVPYFKAGLENNEFCMWVTSDPLTVDDAKAALEKVVQNLEYYMKKGQIEILNYSQWYTKTGKFDAEKVLAGWVEKEKQALKNGFDGLRLTGNTFWIGKQDWKSFKEYEEKVSRVIGNYRMLAICSYSLEKCGSSELLDVISNHQFALIRRNGKWEIIESSERKRMEEDILKNEGKLRKVIDSSPDNITISDLNGNIIDCNQVTADMHGFSKKEDIIGKNALELIAPKDHEKAMEHLKKTLELGAVKNVEYTFLKKDGSEFPAEISASVVRDLSGKPMSFIGVIKDITERKKTETSLREANQYLENLFNYANAPIIVWDPQFAITRFNHAFESLTGRSATDVIGKPLKILFLPDRVESSMEPIRKTQEGKRLETVEIGILHLDGSIRTILWNSATLFAPDGKTIVATIAQGQDITKRKKAEDELRQKETKYRTLVENLPQKIFVKDKNSTYVSCNENYAHDLKIKPDEIAGRTDYEFYPKELAEKYRADDKRIMESGEIEDLEEKYIQNGQERFVHTIKTPLKDEKGTVFGLLGIFYDITERKNTENELRESEERFRTIFDGANDGLLLADLEKKKFFTGNKTICNMLGYSIEEINNLGVMDIHPKEDLPFVVEQFGKQARREIVLAENIPMKRKDGSVFYADINSSPIVIAGKEYLLGSFRDITDHKKAEQELQQSEEKYRALLETTDTGFCILDSQGNILDANSEYVRLSGHSTLEEIMGRSVIEWTAEYDLQRNAEEVKKCMQQGFVRNLEIDYVDKHGKATPVEINATAIQIDKGQKILTLCRDITERKNAERALIDAKEKWHSLTTNTDDIIILADKEGTIQYINRTIPPHTIEKTIGTSLYEYVPKEQKTEMADSIQKVFETEKIQTYEVSTSVPTLGTIWFATKVIPVISDEKISGVILISTDITKRKLPENENKENTERLFTVIERAGEGITFSDAAGHFEVFNSEMQKITGYSVEEANSCKDFTLLLYPDPKERQNALEGLTEIIEKGTPREIEATIQTKDGKKKTLMISTSLFSYKNKDMFLSIYRDITERKRTQEKLLEKEERYHALYEGIRDGYVMTSMDGKIIEYNSFFKKMLGYTDEELHNKTCRDITPEEWHSKEATIIEEQVLKKEYSNIYEKEIIRKDGEIMPVDVRTILLKKDEKPIGMWSFVRDITDRKQTETELMKKMNALEKYKNITVGRELKMIELKKQKKELEEKISEKRGTL